MSVETHKVERLDQALGEWEMRMWMYRTYHLIAQGTYNLEALKRMPQSIGPILHYADLRRHLLGLRSLEAFDYKRFRGDRTQLQTDSYFAEMLAAWTISSRRVYQLDTDLQALLGATSLKEVTMADVQLPFESFGLALVEPIMGSDGETYDFLLFAPILSPWGEEDPSVKKIFALILLNTKLKEWRPTTTKDLIDKKLARRNYADAARLLNKKAKAANRGFPVGLIKADDGADIEEMLNRMKKDGNTMSELTQAFQLVFGLAMYLKMLPPDSKHVGGWQRQTRSARRITGSPDLGSISDESQICEVSSMRRLTPEQRHMLNLFGSGRATGYELSVHFREGHWRRPPYTAHILPLRPKTVHVHPTIVRLDRLPEGAVPAGREVLLD